MHPSPHIPKNIKSLICSMDYSRSCNQKPIHCLLKKKKMSLIPRYHSKLSSIAHWKPNILLYSMGGICPSTWWYPHYVTGFDRSVHFTNFWHPHHFQTARVLALAVCSSSLVLHKYTNPTIKGLLLFLAWVVNLQRYVTMIFDINIPILGVGGIRAHSYYSKVENSVNAWSAPFCQIGNIFFYFIVCHLKNISRWQPCQP